jgi:hypothetical protein
MLKPLLPLLLLLIVSSSVAAADSDESASPYPDQTGSADRQREDKLSCAEKWERYRSSAECFSRYRNVNGSIKSDAYGHCTEVSYPSECASER